jgi:pimeloyl-ACP methyl ester carboxylesterase
MRSARLRSLKRAVTTFLLIPGAGGVAWYWHAVVPRLRDAGHEPIALNLPGDDPGAGLSAYVELALAAIRGHEDLVVVGQSMGAFTAVPVCTRVAARRLVLLNAMLPAAGETADEWWEATAWVQARRAATRASGYAEDFDLQTYFLHDVPPDVAADGAEHQRDEARAAFEEPCPFTEWPALPTTVLAGRDDRFFPFAFQNRVAHERLRMEARALPGGHLAALSQPDAVTRALMAGGQALRGIRTAMNRRPCDGLSQHD